MERHSSKFIGERLKEAREYNELTQSKLADIINVQRQTISAIEKDIQNPSIENTLKLSNSLNFPIEFFFKKKIFITNRVGTVTFRDKSKNTKRKKLKAELYDKWLFEIISYLSNFIEFPKSDLKFDSEVNYKKLNREEIENISDEIRGNLNIGFGPISNLVNLFESMGIFLGVTDLPEEIDAFSSSYKEHVNILMNYSEYKAVRVRFNLAHELGHIILHKYIEEDEYSENFKKIETQAHQFASSFLLPRRTFVKEYFSSDMNSLLRLKQRWKVSIQAIIMRAKDLEIISSEQSSNLFRRLSYAGYRKQEPLDDIILVEKPSLLKKSIELLVENKILSKDRILDDIGIPVKIFSGLINIDDDYFKKHNNIIDFELKLK